MNPVKTEVFSNTSGQISANTAHRPEFKSTFVSVDTQYAEENISVSFYQNYGNRFSERSLSFRMNRQITSGTYSLQSGSNFSFAGYSEVVNIGSYVKPHPFEIISGALTIKATGVGTGTRSYVVENFTLQAKSSTGKTREITGNFSITEEDE